MTEIAAGAARASETAADHPDPLEHYTRLLELAEEQLALAGRGDLDALRELTRRWEEIARQMPRTPPAAAGPLLERASLLSERLRIELQRVRESLLGELAGTARACRAAHGYSLPPQRAHRVDHCA